MMYGITTMMLIIKLCKNVENHILLFYEMDDISNNLNIYFICLQ